METFFNVFSHDAVWAKNGTHHLHNDEWVILRYIGCLVFENLKNKEKINRPNVLLIIRYRILSVKFYIIFTNFTLKYFHCEIMNECPEYFKQRQVLIQN